MKIAITGAHRVGKTSLAEALAEYLPEYALHREPYFELEEAGYAFSATPHAEDFDEQLAYAMKRMRKDKGPVIYDRCPLDLLAYIHVLDPERNIQAFFNTTQDLLSGVDLLVFVPIETPDLIPCPPSDFPGLRQQVHEILCDWVQDLEIDVLEVKGSLEERRMQVLERIGEI